GLLRISSWNKTVSLAQTLTPGELKAIHSPASYPYSGKTSTIVFDNSAGTQSDPLDSFSSVLVSSTFAYKFVAGLTASNTNVVSDFFVLAIAGEIYRKQKKLNYTSRVQTM